MQISEWLGFVINTDTMTFQIPEKKVLKLKNLLSTAITEESSSYHEFARIAGSIISLSLAVGPISVFYQKNVPCDRVSIRMGSNLFVSLRHFWKS